MESKLEITVQASQYVPSEPAARAAWLDSYGVPPVTTVVVVTAELATWARCQARISDQGEVSLDRSNRYGPANDARTLTCDALTAAAVSRLAIGERNVSLGEPDVSAAALLVEAAEAKREAKAAAEEAKAAETRRARIEALRAQGLDAILLLRGSRWEVVAADVHDVRAAFGADAYEAAEREAQSRNDAREAAMAAARVSYDAALSEVATRYDDLARPAAEHYPIERAVLDRLASDLAHEAAPLAEHRIDTRSWSDPEDRASPSPAAFALYDRVTAAVRTANASLPAAIGQWVVSRIVRLDVCPHRGEEHQITCVFATLVTPFATREITWSIESFACDHDDHDG